MLKRNLVQKLEWLGHLVPIIDPLSRFALAWETLISLITIMLFVYIPLVVGFDLDIGCGFYFSDLQNNASENCVTWVLLPMLLLSVDVLVQANTVFFEVDMLNAGHFQIVKHYWQTWFLPDIMTLIFLAASLSNNAGGEDLRTLGLFFLIRLTYRQCFATLSSESNKFKASLSR